MPNLTDDVLTLAPRSRTIRAYFRDGVDRLAGADPGLTQLRTALQAVLGIAVGVGLISIFVPLTGALQVAKSTGPTAVVTAENHGLLIVSMLLAGMVAMMAGFTVNDPTAKGQIITTLWLPIPMIATITVGLALGRYRVPSLVYLVVLLAVAVYVRRWGPRGFAAGLVGFNGGFLGFFLHAELGLHDVGWLAADLAIGVLASLIVRFGLFRPDAERTLERMRRSWQARARRLLGLSIEVLDAETEHRRQNLHEELRRQVVRMNESTLMIDAQLAQTVPDSAAAQAQSLFDAELALSNSARFAAALSAVGAAPDVRRLARDALDEVLHESALDHALDRDTGTGTGTGTGTATLGDGAALAAAGRLRDGAGDGQRTRVLARRLASSIEQFAAATTAMQEAIRNRHHLDPDTTTFTPAVALNAGFLPGSRDVSAAASAMPGRGGLLDRAAMPPYVRSAIQITVAATLAVIVGDVLSGPRLYWAVLATFLAFMATTNSGEQVRKALFRVAGTAIGIVVGDLLVRVTGGHVWSSVAIVMVALFFGIYLIRVNYTFMVIGITVTMSQLYAQLGEFSWHLLVLRLGETAIGVGAVVVTVLLIVPLRPQRVLTTGVLLWFRALSGLLDAALDQLLGADRTSLRPAVRQLDAAYAALEATATPLRRSTFGRNSAQLTEIRSVSAAARNYARSLASEAEAAGALELKPFQAAARQLRASMAAIDNRIETGEHGRYVRCAALVEVAAQSIGDEPAKRQARLALRDLALLDGALARLASALQMQVEDLDTHSTDTPARADDLLSQP